MSEGHAGSGHRVDRLRARAGRPDPRPDRSPLRRAGHRRLRSFGHPREAASLLRSRPLLGHRRGAERARRRRHDRAQGGRGRDRQVQPRSVEAQPDDRLTHTRRVTPRAASGRGARGHGDTKR
ncbi:hypothetical protein BVI434_1050002 [Burkholderia vietnamiensis]|nr:hypothetical protein BVI434_1050002 [Burkholderia vietnamiensis]